MNRDTIRKNITNYYYLNGEIVDIHSQKIVPDENTRLEVMTSHYIYNEARRMFRLSNKSDSIDQLIDNTIDKYGINGKTNELLENKLVRSILESEGHVEVEFLDSSTTGNTFLTGEDKDLAIAMLRYLAREKGFDIGDFVVDVDTSQYASTGKSKITVNFTKMPVLNERPTKKVEEEVESPETKSTTPQDDGHVLTTAEQLAMARKEGNIAMIKYWEDKLEEERLAAIQNGTTEGPSQTTASNGTEPADEETKNKTRENQHTLREKWQATKSRLTAIQEKLNPIWQNIKNALKGTNPDIELGDEPDIDLIDRNAEACRAAGDVKGEQIWQKLSDLANAQKQAKEELLALGDGIHPISSGETRMASAQDNLTTSKNEKSEYEKTIKRWENLLHYLTDPKKKNDMTYLQSQLSPAQEAKDESTIAKWQREIAFLMVGEYPESEMDKANVTKIITSIESIPTEEEKTTFAEEQLTLSKEMLAETEKNIRKWERVLYLETPEGQNELNFIQSQIDAAEEIQDEATVAKWEDEKQFLLTGEYPKKEEFTNDQNSL